MPIINSVRNVLPGYGTSGLRGGHASGPSPLTIEVHQGMSMGKLRVQSNTTQTTIRVTGTDGSHPGMEIFGTTLPAGFGEVSISADFITDLNMTEFTCHATGNIDFEIWGQPGAAASHT